MKSKVRTEYIGELPVDLLTHQEIMDDLESYLKAKEKMIVTSVNPQISLLAFEHPEVKLYLKRATHRIADGIGVVKASKLMGGSIRERVTGIDVMDNFLEYA
ncbi:WecB/TagA/CpsF family glycosyltransferase, partial [Enterococcus faecium]